MIEAQDIGHWYKTGHWLFRHVSVAFRPGTISAILGVNGSGKTTFLRTLCGALRPREGHISLDGVIGYVPQAQLADCAFRAVDMVLLGRSRYLGRFSSPRSSDILRALECLDEVGMSGVAEQNYDQLSGGQRQLVLLARALATDCSVLILDEPVSALDLANQGVVLRLLQRLAATRNLSILFTTHAPDHALSIARDALLFLDDAKHIFGPVAATMTDENLSQLYRVPMRRVSLTTDSGRVESVLPFHRLNDP
jgi:iron complex transport system ATP-binding protein